MTNTKQKAKDEKFRTEELKQPKDGGELMTVVEKNTMNMALERIKGMTSRGELQLPKNYSYQNAVRSMMFELIKPMAFGVHKGKRMIDVVTTESAYNTIQDMVAQGLSPGKKQCYPIPYTNKETGDVELQLQRSYFGTLTTAKRIGGVRDVFAQVVYKTDQASEQFSYELDFGEVVNLEHKIDADIRQNPQAQITWAYAVVKLTDGGRHVEVMTIDEIKKAWNQGNAKGESPAHKNFAQEMAKKVVINRALKTYVNSSMDDDVFVEAFNRTTEHDYTPTDSEGNPVVDVDYTIVEKTEGMKATDEALFGKTDDISDENVEQAQIPENDIKDAETGENEPQTADEVGGDIPEMPEGEPEPEKGAE